MLHSESRVLGYTRYLLDGFISSLYTVTTFVTKRSVRCYFCTALRAVCHLGPLFKRFTEKGNCRPLVLLQSRDGETERRISLGVGLTVRLASLEDIFLFKTVAERRDDIDDMAALVQTDLDFEAIRDEIAVQAELLGGERFTTIISESLGRLEYRHGIQTPLDEAIDEYYERYLSGYELRTALDEETPRRSRNWRPIWTSTNQRQ